MDADRVCLFVCHIGIDKVDRREAVAECCCDADCFFSKSVPASTRLEDPSRKGTTRMAKSAPFNPCPSREGPYSTVFFGEPAHGPPHVAGGASGPIGGCREESRTDNPDLDLRHVFDRNNRKTDLI